MGQGQSGGATGAQIQEQQVQLQMVEGFQVVRLLPLSPAHQAGLVPYFDIITALDQQTIADQQEPHFKFFKGYLSDHRNQQVCFTVYNLRLRGYREVYISPSDAWGGGGLLGCSVEWTRADQSAQRCWHIVGILDGSPASFCPDLAEERDYIIGMQQPDEQLISMIKSDDDFYSRLAMWQELQRSALERRQRFPDDATIEVPHSLLLLLYDSQENSVKEVLVDMGTRPGTPLGISVASGLLHIIPPAPQVPVNDGGDGSASVPDLAGLPTMNRFFLPRDLNFDVNYSERPFSGGSGVATTGAALAAASTAAGPQPPVSASTLPASHHAAPSQQPQQPPHPQEPEAVVAGGQPPMHNPFAGGLDDFPPREQQEQQELLQRKQWQAAEEERYRQMQREQERHERQAQRPQQWAAEERQRRWAALQPQGAPPPPQPPHPPHPSHPQGHAPQQSPSVPPQQQQPQPPQQPVRFNFPPVPPPLSFPTFPRPQKR